MYNNGKAEVNYMCNLRSPESSESLLLRLCTGQTPGSFQRQFICTLKSFLSRMRPDVLFMVVNHEFHLKTYLFLAVSDLSCSMQNLHCRKGTYLPHGTWALGSQTRD